MTLYHGGKKRLGKELANVIVTETDKICKQTGFQVRGYCEPFCGMLGVYQHIPDLMNDRYRPTRKLKYKASDANGCVVEMWKAAKEGWKPPTRVTEKRYSALKRQKIDTAVRGYVGHQYGYNGVFFSSYMPKYNSSKFDSTYASQSVHRIGKILKTHNIDVETKDFKSQSRLRGYVIYCDPPYNETKSEFFTNEGKSNFDTAKFWEWCARMAKHNIVFVSEYSAPRGAATAVFKKEVANSHANASVPRRTETLYLVK